MTGLIVGVDLGKSGCRIAIARRDGTMVGRGEGRGAVGMAEPAGWRDAAAVIADLVARTVRGKNPAGDAFDVVCIGAAGVFVESSASASLSVELIRSLGVADVAVTSDAVVSHAGALGGEPGVVTAIGTGAVTFAVAGDGRFHQVDGWGQWLGDDGSGAWIGRAALHAALQALDGRGPRTALCAAAERRFGPLATLPGALPFDGNLPRATAAFAPDVLACAGDGDAVAAAIIDEAVRCWVAATHAAVDALGERRVTCVGGLASVHGLRDQWATSLRPDLDVVPAGGDAVAGALLLAGRADLPHEALVYRHA